MANQPNLKVKIICTGPRAARDSLHKVMHTFKVQCSRANRVNAELLLLYCNSNRDIDLIFSHDCLTELKKIDCQPQIPTYLKAKRSIIIKRLDPLIYSQETDYQE